VYAVLMVIDENVEKDGLLAKGLGGRFQASGAASPLRAVILPSLQTTFHRFCFFAPQCTLVWGASYECASLSGL
jgi:hypothetical protein